MLGCCSYLQAALLSRRPSWHGLARRCRPLAPHGRKIYRTPPKSSLARSAPRPTRTAPEGRIRWPHC